MPKLPSVLDYGQRPSLQSNRVDRPDESGLIMAEELANAASTFAKLAGEKKAKDDRLNYSLAKNELLRADIVSREALNDREDYDKFDEDYTAGYKQAADDVFARYKLSQSDRALLSAESEMIRTRGRVYAGDLARTKRLDWQRGQIEKNLDAALIEIQDSPPELQADLLNTQLENITAGIEQGVYGDEEGQARAQKFVKDASIGALGAMEAEDRIAEIKLSLAHRAARGPISPEELEAGGGTGSIADYVHTDVLRKMLDQAETENEMENKQALAFEAFDAAWELYPEYEDIRERERFIADALRDNPEARKEANILDSQKTGRYATADTLDRGETGAELLAAINSKAVTYEELDPNKLAKLNINEQNALKLHARRVAEEDGFANETLWEAQQLWESMTPQERAATDLEGFMHRDQSNPSGDNIPWKAVVTRDYGNLMLNQRRLAQGYTATGKVPQEPGGLSDTQFFEQYLVGTPYFDRKPVTGDSKELKDRWSAIAIAWDKAIVAEGEASGGKISESRRREILGEIMRQEVFVRKRFAADPRYPAVALSEEQMQEAYIPLDQKVSLNGIEATIFNTYLTIPAEHGGGDQNAYEWIVNTWRAEKKTTDQTPSPEEVEEIWFYLVTDGFDAAKKRIQGIEGY